MQGMYRTKGFGLLEVLMTALVLSIGLLGAAILQTKSAKLANKAKYASSAAILANELATAMYANPTGVSHFDFSQLLKYFLFHLLYLV